MTIDELNAKYSHAIEQGFNGVESNFTDITDYLDRLFHLLIHRNQEFKLKQIKMKCSIVSFKSNLHLLYNENDRQRDHNLSLKIQSRLQKQVNFN